jgi:hypothetical protein
MSTSLSAVEARRAIEALRAGVPNRDVVRFLEPHQNDIKEKFDALLENLATSWGDDSLKPLPGLLLEADFGAGKSHWLEAMRHLALEANFVVSQVVLNKETPLHDLGKIYRACVEAAVAPDLSGPALGEIAHHWRSDSAPHYQQFFDYANHTPGIDPRLATTLRVFEKHADEAVLERVLAEWTGNPMLAGDLKFVLREIGDPVNRISPMVKGQFLTRFEFLARFFRSAGYNGWIILLDETEMISRYSLRQRGRAYAHLAQLMGLDKNARAFGMGAVFTITKDYSSQVLRGRKDDLHTVPARLETTPDAPYIAAAETGMKAIERHALDLRPPTKDQVNAIGARARELYSTAYNWEAPPSDAGREYSLSTGLRQYLRTWINAWDLRRLYGVEADIVVEEVQLSYEEDTDLQREKRDDEPEIAL